VQLAKCSSKEEFLESVQEGKKTCGAEQWLVCSGWNEQTLKEFPQKSWLDPAGSTPTLCWRSDYHCALVNDAVLELFDLDQLSQLTGGEACRSGIIKETALWEHVCKKMPELSPAQTRTRLSATVDDLHAAGVTLVGTMEELQDIEAILSPARTQLHVRIRAMVIGSPTTSTLKRVSSISQDDNLKITGFKTFADGTLGSRTAKMYAPYRDVSSSGTFVGLAASKELDLWVTRVVEAGFSPVIHAIGDEAVGLALDSSAHGTGACVPRIEHAQFIDPRDLHKLSGRWFGVQPLHLAGDARIAQTAVGIERAERVHAWRTMLDRGAHLSFGSDWPIAPHTPLAAMQAAIGAGVTAKEALIASTSAAALSLSEPQAGRLDLGCYADATVLTQNPLTNDWTRNMPEIAMTIVGGEIQYKNEVANE
jgi:hypothetical protein